MSADKKRDELNTLADRCEREDPNRHLDAAIAFALGWRLKEAILWKKPGSNAWETEAPIFTISLDVTAAPDCEGVFWRSGHDGEGPDPSLFKAEVLVVTEAGSRSSFGRARTEAMARRAAELRARAGLIQ